MKEKKVQMLCLFFIILVASIFLAVDFSRLRTLPYGQTIEENCLTTADFIDSEGIYDQKYETSLFISEGEGLKHFSANISLLEGDYFLIKFQANNLSGNSANLIIDLFGPEFDSPYNEVQVSLQPGNNLISRTIEYRGYNEPESCLLRIFTYDNKEVEITGLTVHRMAYLQNENNIASIFYLIFLVLAGLVFVVIMGIFVSMKRKYPIKERPVHFTFRSKRNEAFLYLLLFILISGILLLLYKNVNIMYPMVYTGGDEIAVYYQTKTICENGITLITPLEAGASIGNMLDYPYSDKISFTLVKLISLFTNNPYLTINLFYFLCFHLVGAFALFACRKLNLSKISSMTVALLYAFSPYIQMRYAHMWLIPYFMIPIACLIGVYIIEGKFICAETGKVNWPKLWKYMIPSFLCSFTGLYYAFFSCAIFSVAIVIRLLTVWKKKRLLYELYPCLFLIAAITGVITNVLPNCIYWIINGVNSRSEIAIRARGDSELYGLKMTQLILPRIGHRIDILANLTNFYNSAYPLVNENSTASLGIIASIGFVISLFRMLLRKKEYHAVAILNTAIFLIGTIGGVGGLISVFIKIPMRCYNRLSLVIMFLSLAMVMFIIEKVKLLINRKYLHICICFCLICIGIFDQTVTVNRIDYSSYESTRDFINVIEGKLEKGDMIFEFPYDNWPSPTIPGSYMQHMGYIESDGIDWSYGSMQGRSEANWQMYASELPVDKMIKLLRKSSYDGLYMDQSLYRIKYGEDITQQRIREICVAVGGEPIISKDENLYFWVLN